MSLRASGKARALPEVRKRHTHLIGSDWSLGFVATGGNTAMKSSFFSPRCMTTQRFIRASPESWERRVYYWFPPHGRIFFVVLTALKPTRSGRFEHVVPTCNDLAVGQAHNHDLAIGNRPVELAKRFAFKVRELFHHHRKIGSRDGAL